MVNVHGGATVALVVAVLLVLLVVLGVLAALALVLRGSKPSDRAELVRTVAELVRACHPGRGGFALTGGSSGTDQDKHPILADPPPVLRAERKREPSPSPLSEDPSAGGA
jgi:hypothetical protein